MMVGIQGQVIFHGAVLGTGGLSSLSGPHLLDAQSTPIMTTTGVPQTQPMSPGGRITLGENCSCAHFIDGEMVPRSGPVSWPGCLCPRQLTHAALPAREGCRGPPAREGGCS